MAQTEHYNFWYLDPDEEISDFPNTWNYNVDKFDAAIHEAATDNVTVARIPNLPASKTTSGTFADARIPDSIARTSATKTLESRIKDLENANRSTGPRDITDSVSDVTDGLITILRTGNIVELYFHNAEFSESGNRSIWTLPGGFRPNRTATSSGARGMPLSGAWDEVGGKGTVNAFSTGGLWLSADSETTLNGICHWLTPDSWPSNSPGEPA